METREFICKTEAETAALGKKLAESLKAPAVIALYGDLGAGKTAFVRGFATALGVDNVTSPTFTIVHEYDTMPPLMHFDAYRLADGDALYDIGFDDYLRRNGYLLLEWAELVEDALPKERLNITIVGSGDEPRTIRLCPVGERYEKMVEHL